MTLEPRHIADSDRAAALTSEQLNRQAAARGTVRNIV
jgi:hypothetical protein